MWTYAWREITRRKARSGLTILSVFIGTALLVSVWGVIRSLQEGVAAIFRESGSDMTAQSFIEPGPYKKARMARHLGPVPQSAVERIRALSGVQYAAGQLHFWVWMPQVKAMSATAGIEPQMATKIGPLSSDIQLISGRLLEPGDEGKAVIDAHYADKWEVKVGDSLDLCDQQFEVVGIVLPKALRAAEAEVYIPLRDAQVILQREQPSLVRGEVVNNILIRVTDLDMLPKLEKQVMRIIKEESQKTGVPAKKVFVFTSSKVFPQATGISVLAQKAAQAIAIIVLVMMVLIVIRTALGSVAERIGEIGVMKAVGWRNADVSKLLTFELLLQGLIGSVLGCIVGELVVFGWSKAVVGQIPHAMNPFPCVPAIPMPTKVVIPFVASPGLVVLALAIHFFVVMPLILRWASP